MGATIYSSYLSNLEMATYEFTNKINCTDAPGSANHVVAHSTKEVKQILKDNKYLFELLRLGKIVKFYLDYEVEYLVGTQPPAKKLEKQFRKNLKCAVDLVEDLIDYELGKPYICDGTREKKDRKGNLIYKFSKHVSFKVAVRMDDLYTLIKADTPLGKELNKIGFDTTVYKKTQKMRFMTGKEPGDEPPLIPEEGTKLRDHLIQYVKGLPVAGFLSQSVEDTESEADSDSEDETESLVSVPTTCIDTVESIQEMLTFLPEEYVENRELWIKIGMALHSKGEQLGDEEMFEVWDEWSQQSDRYDAKSIAKDWRSFSRGEKHTKPIKFATLAKVARDNGYSPKSIKADLLGEQSCFRTMTYNELAIKWGKNVNIDKRKDEFHDDIAKVVRFFNNEALICSHTFQDSPIIKIMSADTRQGFLSMPGHILHTILVKNQKNFVERLQKTSIPRYIVDNLGIDLLRTGIDYKPHTEDKTVEEQGGRLNLFTPHDVHRFPEPEAEDYEQAEKLIEHIEFLFGHVSDKCSASEKKRHSLEQKQFALKCIWSILHNPSVQLQVMIAVVNSPQGVGKDLLAQLLKRVVGSTNYVGIPKLSDISKDFNSILEGKHLAVIGEAHPETKEDMAGEAKIKDMLTNDTIWIERKCKDKHQIDNSLNAILFSNYPDGVTPPGDSRRHFIVEAPPSVRSVEYYNELWDIVIHNDRAVKAFYYRMSDYAQPNYNFTRKENIPRGKYFRDLAKLKENAVETLMREIGEGTVELDSLNYVERGVEKLGYKKFYSKKMQELLIKKGRAEQANMVFIKRDAVWEYIKRKGSRLGEKRLELHLEEYAKKKDLVEYSSFKGIGRGILFYEFQIRNFEIDLDIIDT